MTRTHEYVAEPTDKRHFEHGRKVLRTGRLRRDWTYMVVKHHDGRQDLHKAPAGALVEWGGERSSDWPRPEGEVVVWWCYLPGYSNGAVGFEEHEVEWDD